MIGFINKFKEYKAMSPIIEKELLSKIKVLHKRKGDFLYRENQFPNSVYLITKGCLRTFYHKNGKEKNTMFIFENLIFHGLNPCNNPQCFFTVPKKKSILVFESNSNNGKTIMRPNSSNSNIKKIKF